MSRRADLLAKSIDDTGEPTIARNLSWAANRLGLATDTPRLEAELLLAHVLRCSRTSLFAHPRQSLLPHQLTGYNDLVNRRARGEPLPYLTGRTEFFGLEFFVDTRVLIPRPETEVLVDSALLFLQNRLDTDVPPLDAVQDPHPVVADVGTGSGCVGIALAVHAPQARIYAIDISKDALEVARMNAERHNVTTQMTFLQSDLLKGLEQLADLIVANPPYIADSERPALPREIREHEPNLALEGGRDGLCIVRRLLRQASSWLRPGGAMLIEIGSNQGMAATDLAQNAFPGAEIKLHPDLAGRDRVLSIVTTLDPGVHA